MKIANRKSRPSDFYNRLPINNENIEKGREGEMNCESTINTSASALCLLCVASSSRRTSWTSSCIA